MTNKNNIIFIPIQYTREEKSYTSENKILDINVITAPSKPIDTIKIIIINFSSIKFLLLFIDDSSDKSSSI